MNQLFSFLSLLALYSTPFFTSHAQTTFVSDSAVYQQTIHNTVERYREHTGVQALIYQGKEFTDYRIIIDGHQFFESDTWEEGWIRYDGLLYSAMQMKYDVVNAAVLVQHELIAPAIKLETEKISSFAISGHNFIRMVKDSLHTEVPNTGFYDLLYTGKKVDLLAARKKTLQDAIEDRKVIYWFEEASRFYIRKEGVYYPVKNKKSVLKVFFDQKKALRKFIKKNKLKFRRQTEAAILNTVLYYDQLPPSP